MHRGGREEGMSRKSDEVASRYRSNSAPLSDGHTPGVCEQCGKQHPPHDTEWGANQGECHNLAPRMQPTENNPETVLCPLTASAIELLEVRT